MDTVLKIVDPVIEFVRDRGINQVTYIFCYTKNFEELNKRVKRLGEEKERLDRQRDKAKRKGDIVEDRVEEWFGEMGEFEIRVEKYMNDAGHKKTRGFYYLLPYYRHKLGRQAKKMEMEALRLKDECPKDDEVSHAEKVTSFDRSNPGYIELASRKSILEDIMTKLKDPNIKIIGLHGAQGMGKSTLIKKIANKAKDEGLFDRVAEIDVTEYPNPLTIQADIAHVLGLPLAGESENVRADYLRRWLKIESVSILIILDNLHERLDLNRLGIPVDDDYDLRKKNELSITPSDNKQDSKEPKPTSGPEHVTGDKLLKKTNFLGDYRGWKILLSSRDKKVFPQDVGSSFSLKKLDENDALMLFEKKAGGGNKRCIPKQEIQNYCEGLPTSIVTFAEAFKNWSQLESEPTLDKFKKQKLVEWKKSLKTNKIEYELPKTEELIFIFLLCAQMGHLPLVNDLVKYCFGLGILEGVSSLSAAREKINESIQELKNLSLVSYENPNIHFSMSHMVRDYALSNALKDHKVFALRDGKLDDWPELKSCISISICNSDITYGFPQYINCPQLKFLQIETNDPSLEIPESFFRRMKKLRVLILIGFHLSSLSYSIECLLNLRMLCLERCILDCNLSVLRKFEKLQILSFSGSRLKNLPVELRYLDKLQLLDISDCFKLNIVPPNLFSNLTCLEELYIRKSLIKMLVERGEKEGQNSFLSELKNLHQLKVVDLSIPYVSVFPNHLFFDRLKDYKIEIGDFEMFSIGEFRNKYEELKVLALQLKDDTDIHSYQGIKLLFKTTQSLLLGNICVQNVVNELNIDGFRDLKHLCIINNNDVKYVNSTDLSNCVNIFPNLESMCLCNMMNLKMICRGPITLESFAKLKTIKVEMCCQLENLFSFYAIKISTRTGTSEIFKCNSNMKKFLASLEMIEVCECESLKEILQIPRDCGEVCEVFECESLKEILQITQDYGKVEFLKLRTLTLQSLPSFTCFYTKVERTCWPHSTEAQTTNRSHIEISAEQDCHSDNAPPLFGEPVEVPNLENLNLSSLNIRKIWSDQHLSSFYFQNLIKLVVKDCDKLTHLCSLPMASSLKKLKSLVISGCLKMEKIFEIEGISANKVCVFPKLEEIHLSKMKRLTDMWQTKVGVGSFSSLISVSIEECDELDKIFPSHMEGWFESLINLKVSKCKSVKEIFEINDSQEIDASGGIDTNLQVILLEELPKLKELWSKDPDGILNFKKLRTIDVSKCDELRNLFPVSMLKDVSKLERMSILHCERMVEIVSNKDASEANNDPLEFPELTFVRLYELPNMKQFYKGRRPIKCPKLKELSMGKCMKLKTFPQETSDEKFVFSTEAVFPNLEYMETDFEEAQNWFSKYQMQNLKELIILSSVQRPDLLYPFLYKMPNLEKLKLTSSYSESLETLRSTNNWQQDRLGVVLQLKQLLICSSKLKDLGFERDQVLERLELLRLKGCYNLSNLGPSSVSLSYLTCLKLKRCNGLKNLVASSTAKTMVQLKTMKVIDCRKVEEIVSNDRSEEGKGIKIVFSKLISIELVGLMNMTSFCGYKNCEFEFPLLEILIVRTCPKMEKFSERGLIAPKLKEVFGVEGDKKAKWQWEGDLNDTIQKVFHDKLSFAYTEDLFLDEQLWQASGWVQQNSFGYLKSLSFWGCDSVVHVIPSHLLSCFPNLEVLDVWHCSNAEVIFNINDENRVMITKASPIFRLKRLTLICLPKLEHVWEKDPEGIMGLQALQEMCVVYCGNLKSLFPASLATRDLTTLRLLEVRRCKELREIFGKDEKVGEGTTQHSAFPLLTTLELKGLPSLKYSIHCSKQQESTSNLSEGDIQELCLGSLSIRNSYFGLLESLTLDSCQVLSDVLLPFNLLPFLTNLKTLEVGNFDSVKTIFDVKCTTQDREVASVRSTLPFSLKKLTLSNLPNLKNVWNEDPRGIISMSNLQKVYVEECKALSSVFPLGLAGEDVLLPFCLLPFLTNLETLKVQNCDSVKAIFDVKCSTQGRDLISVGHTLPFSLKKLTLSNLTNLRNVWNEDPQVILSLHHLQKVCVEECECLTSVFPASKDKYILKLENLEVKDCKGLMTIFGDDNIHPRTKLELTVCCPFVKSLKLECLPNFKYFYYSSPYGDIFTDLESHTENQVGTETCMSVGENGMKMILRGELERKVLDSLKALTLCFGSDVFGCKILEEVRNIEKLVVCDGSFKEMFCCESRNNVLQQLKVLHLESLEELVSIGLENSWTDSFVRNLKTFEVISCESLKNLVACTVSFSNLTCLKVENCKRLSHLFSSSTAKSLVQLKRMEIKDCESIEEIVSNKEESDEDEIIFPQLNYLNLYSLWKLRRFYHGSLSFPSLEEFSVRDCSQLMSLCTGIVVVSGRLSEAIDLNSVTRKRFLKERASSWRYKSLEFRDRADLQEIWCLALPDLCFTYLETLIVNECKISSDAVLPFTLLPLLPKLETLEVRNCHSVKTIFDSVKCTTQDTTTSLKKLVLRKLPNLETIWNEDTDEIVTEPNPAHPEVTNPKLTFPTVTSFTLCDLPNFNHNTIYCINEAIATSELIIPNLEDLTVGKNELKMIVDGEFQTNLLHNLKVLGLCFDIECDEFPEYGFLQQLPNVKKLMVWSSSFKLIFCHQRPNNSELLLQLKELRLECLEKLVYIGLENPWTELFVSNLETFEVITCSSLENLATCTVSFTNLRCLKVENCDGLSYLFTSSTAKSLGRLERMEIKQCKSIEEILCGEKSDDEIIFSQLSCLELASLPNLRRFYRGNLSFPSLEELSVTHCDDMVTLCPSTLKADKLTQVTIDYQNIPLDTDLNSTTRKEFRRKISKLQELKLKSRPKLPEIWHDPLYIPDLCFSKLVTLTVKNCQFLSDAVLPFHLLPLLPKLETLEVRKCDYVKTIFNLKRATKDTLVTLPPKKLTLSNLPNLENIWSEDPPGILIMHHLKEVYVKECKGLTSVFPASAAKDLVKLKDLVVDDCEGLKAIVGEESKEDEIIFPQLMYLKVQSCNSLPYLFTSSTAKSLGELKSMKIKECKSIEEIISKEGEESDEKVEIKFEQLQDLYLEKLDELRCFYDGNFTLNFPSLEEVHVIKCSSMKTFSAFNKIDNPWYYSEYARPRKVTHLNSALHRTSEEEAPNASSAIISVLQ